MTKLFDLQSKVGSTVYEISNEKIKQTQRNALKKEVLDTLLETFAGAGFDVERTNDGVILVLDAKNTEINVAIDAVIKNLDYEVDVEVSEYNLKLEKQAERERAKAEKVKASK